MECRWVYQAHSSTVPKPGSIWPTQNKLHGLGLGCSLICLFFRGAGISFGLGWLRFDLVLVEHIFVFGLWFICFDFHFCFYNCSVNLTGSRLM